MLTFYDVRYVFALYVNIIIIQLFLFLVSKTVALVCSILRHRFGKNTHLSINDYGDRRQVTGHCVNVHVHVPKVITFTKRSDVFTLRSFRGFSH